MQASQPAELHTQLRLTHIVQLSPAVQLLCWWTAVIRLSTALVQLKLCAARYRWDPMDLPETDQAEWAAYTSFVTWIRDSDVQVWQSAD